MNLNEAANELLAKADGDELAVYQEFAEEFDAVIEGWEMRIQELATPDKETDAQKGGE